MLIVMYLLGQTCQPVWPQAYVDTKYSLPTGKTITVNAGGNLQAAIDQANPGDVIELQAGVTFSGNFILRKKASTRWIYIRTSNELKLSTPGSRISPSEVLNMARILSLGQVPAFSTEPGAGYYRLIGLEIGMPENSPDQFTLVSFGTGTETKVSELPGNLIIDRCYIHGNNTGNLKVGVALNCLNSAIIDSRIDNIHAESGVSTFESKAISCYNGPGPFKIVNNYLEASHITILFGGAKSSIADLVPSDVEIRCNVMTKRVSWNPVDPSFAGKFWGVKNIFEIKSGQRMLIEGNIFENCWPSEANVAGGPQSGFAIVLSTRDENGSMPWCVVQDLNFRNNIFRNSNAGVSFYGSEGKGEHRILFYNNLFDNIGGSWGNNDKTGRLFQATSIDDLCFDHNTMLHTANNILFAYGTVNGISMKNNISQWHDGFQGVNYSTWDKNVFIAGKTTGFTNTNYFPANMALVKFANYAAGDYHLAADSPYKNSGTDGKDIGCDINVLNDVSKACANVVTKIQHTIKEESIFLVYPSPNKGIFKISMIGIGSKEIVVYDLLGREIPTVLNKGENATVVSIKDKYPGMYLVKVFGDYGLLKYSKVIVE
jgi:hypothetical protein